MGLDEATPSVKLRPIQTHIPCTWEIEEISTPIAHIDRQCVQEAHPSFSEVACHSAVLCVVPVERLERQKNG